MIIGVTGMIGSGKGEATRILVEKGFQSFSMGDEIRKEAHARGLEVTRENLSALGTVLSKEEGEAFVQKRIVSKLEVGKQYVVEGFRFTEDLRPFMKRADFVLIGVTAPLDVRWKRIKERGRGGDVRTFEEFVEVDERENSGGSGQEVQNCLELADYILVNDGWWRN